MLRHSPLPPLVLSLVLVSGIILAGSPDDHGGAEERGMPDPTAASVARSPAMPPAGGIIDDLPRDGEALVRV